MPPKARDGKVTTDPRFASLHSDPRFVRPKRQTNKIAKDDRFKDLLSTSTSSAAVAGPSGTSGAARTDKYGRKIAKNAEKKELQKFYRMDKTALAEAESEGEAEDHVAAPGDEAERALAYARGEILMQSSDEEEGDSDEESEIGGEVQLGPGAQGRQYVQADSDGEDYEIDLDEDAVLPDEAEEDEIEATTRLAAVNMDWDHVRAIDLFKVFASVLSSDAPDASTLPPALPLDDNNSRRVVSRVAKGRITKVTIYPSEFGKSRLEREELEGPPKEIFAGLADEELEPEEVDETNVLQPDEGEEFNQKALRRYQLERLRYYYAVVQFNTTSAAKHAFHEIQGTEFERSANMFELRFIPEDMTFDDVPKDVADSDQADYQANEYVTDALRNSKVKLTWDADDPQRSRLTRLDTTKMSKKDVEALDFQVYLASSSESDDEDNEGSKKETEREKMRKLFGLDDKPIGSKGKGKEGEMEITFAPALQEQEDGSAAGEETTIQAYKRKEKERKQRKKAAKTPLAEEDGSGSEKEEAGFDDTFFEDEADIAAAFEAHDQGDSPSEAEDSKPTKKSKSTKAEKERERLAEEKKAAELNLLMDEDSDGGKHFDMTDIMRTEKDERSGKKSRSARRKMAKAMSKTGTTAKDAFAIDVKDDRFSNLHQDHQFAIDPSNPRYRKTKNMDRLLEETRKRRDNDTEAKDSAPSNQIRTEKDADIASLVASVKRKSQNQPAPKGGKRRKTAA